MKHAGSICHPDVTNTRNVLKDTAEQHQSLASHTRTQAQ